MKKLILILFSSITALVSCSKSSSIGGSGSGGGGSTNCSGVASKFSADVNPIIQSTCATEATCHGNGSLNGPGPLLTYTQIFNARVNIKNAVNAGTMPKTGSLTAAQKSTIICWIDGGALNN